MKLNKLMFKKVKYGSVVAMGGYSLLSNEWECVQEGNVSYSYTQGCEGS